MPLLCNIYLIEKLYAQLAGLSCSAISCGQHLFQQLMCKELSSQMQLKGLQFAPKNWDYCDISYYLLFFSPWYVAQLVLFPATALQLLPLTQQKVQNEPCQCRQKKAVLKKKWQWERGTRSSRRQVVWEALGNCRSMELCAVFCNWAENFQREGGYFTKAQTAVTGILLYLVFALWKSGWNFMAIKTLALPKR